jgi:NTE family protein
MPTLRQWLKASPFTLTMSSGFFGFFAHAGVLSVLEEEDIWPSSVGGSSAGALVTGLWAAGVPASSIIDELLRVDRAAFWDPGPGLGLLQGRLFRRMLERILPVQTFEQCRVPARISVFDIATRRTRSLTSGELAAAIQASCAVPLLFHPLRHAGRAFYDGGILDRPGLAGVPPEERVFYHHLPSRVPFPRLHPLLGRTLPQREGLISLVVEGLPRLGPFRLNEGRRAIDIASEAARAMLDRPLSGAVARFPG